MYKHKLLATLGVAAVAAGGAAPLASAVTTPVPSPKAGPALPAPSRFAKRVDNPWFPLKPGTTRVYRGVKDGKPARDVFTVTHKTRMIKGIRATVVKDRLYLAGKLAERTTDWYAQDGAGNVWYLGEATATLDPNGKVTSTDGTWMTGVDGAEPGIYMPAHPRVGQSGRQEYYKGHAEDNFRVLSRKASVKVLGASSHRALKTEEWTPLEPGVLDHKFYVRGVGNVLEQAVNGGTERLALVSVQHR